MPSEDVIRRRIAALDDVARDVFGYPSGPKPFQREVAAANFEGHNVFGVAPTGEGKSFCFQAVAIIRPGLTLVVSPLVALMKDQVDKLKRWGVAADRLGGDMDADAQRRVYNRMPELSLLYVAPERLKSKPFQDAIARCNVVVLALDEAHVLSKWGREFRPSYTQLRSFIADRPKLRVMVLTATADKQVEADLVHMLGLTTYKRVIGSPDRPNLNYTAGHDLHTGQLADMLNAQLDQPGVALVYAQTRAEVEKVASEIGHMVRGGVLHYHAGLDGPMRTVTQDRFLAGETRCMVATKAFGMGVDKPDVRLVVHWQQPASVFDYAQEAGRAGRDGKPSRCHLNISDKGRNKIDYFIRMGNPPMWVYEKLWDIITARGKHGGGAAVMLRRAYLDSRMNLKKGLDGYTDAALSFLEFTGHFEALPGPSTYELPVRDIRKVREFMQRYRSVKLKVNTVTVTTDEGEDPVQEMVDAGAVQMRPPDQSMVLKLRRGALGITETIRDEKQRAAERAADQVEEFASVEDKAGYLRRIFLETNK